MHLFISITCYAVVIKIEKALYVWKMPKIYCSVNQERGQRYKKIFEVLYY